jgi:hypothetical protein
LHLRGSSYGAAREDLDDLARVNPLFLFFT